jgi:hypothetical protein
LIKRLDLRRDGARGARAAALRQAPVDGNVLVDVIPAMLVFGIGAGLALNPCARRDERRQAERGRLASGVVSTSFMMGGALGLAVLASVAASRRDHCARLATMRCRR